jgi:hypothetical protein
MALTTLNNQSISNLTDFNLSSNDMPSGSVLAVHDLESPVSTAQTINTSTLTEMDTFTLSCQANSKFVWFMDTQQYIKGGTTVNPIFKLVVDGTSVGPASGYGDSKSASFQHPFYGQNTFREVQFNYFVTGNLSSGSHTFQMMVAQYNPNGGNITVKYQGAKIRYLAYEISG